MAEVSGLSLSIAVQAIAAEMRAMEQERSATAEDSSERADLDELLLSYWKAAQEIKRAYIEEQQSSDNLSPYEDLVGDTETHT